MKAHRYLPLAAALLLTSIPAYAADIELNVATTSKEVIDNLPFYVAERAGLYQKTGIKVALNHFPGGGEVVRAVASGAADVGMVATSAGITAIGRGEPMRIFSAWTAPAFGIVWVALKDSAINSASDLSGKKTGISRPASVSHTGALAALKAVGLEGKANIVPVGSPGDSWAAVKSGRVDIGWQAAPQVYTLVDSGEAKIVFQISDYVHDYQEGALLARLDTIKGKGEALKKFLAAIQQAINFIASSPDKAIEYGAAEMEVPEGLVRKTLSAEPKGFYAIGVPTSQNMDGSIAEAMQAGSLKQAPSYDDIVDKSLIQ